MTRTVPALAPADPDTDPTPSDLVYDDMTAAWRDGNYRLTWALATVLTSHLAGGGLPLTAPRDPYYAESLRKFYAPPPS